MHLIDTVSSYGQLYVSLSRETHPDKLNVCLSFHSDSHTVKVVHPEAVSCALQWYEVFTINETFHKMFYSAAIIYFLRMVTFTVLCS